MLTQKYLKSILHYDPCTGIFIRAKSVGYRGCHKKGKIAGHFNKTNNYQEIRIGKFLYKASVLAWLYMTGFYPKYQIDHIDRDTTNNKWGNLRHVTPLCNTRNRGINKNNTSGVTGVIYNRDCKKWVAAIMLNRKRYHLGLFSDFSEAVCHRLAAEQCLDWSNCNSNTSAHKYVQKYIMK